MANAFTQHAPSYCGKDELLGVLRDLTSTKLFTNQEFYSIHIYKGKCSSFQMGKYCFFAST